MHLSSILTSLSTVLTTSTSTPFRAMPHPNKPIITESSPEIGFSQSISTEEKCISHRSKFQKIEIYKSRHYGKVLVLDDVVNLTERDADSYNEMLTHVPMMEHGDPKRVLVIGGGDGYVLKEVLKYKSVQHVDHVELDSDVIRLCKTHFPSTSSAWEDQRVHLHIEDGIHFVRNAPSDYYDVVIQDSSDPFTVKADGEEVTLPSSVLYSPDHFREIHRVLREGGVLNFQSETIHIPMDLEGVVRWRKHALEVGFASAEYGMLFISTYLTGQIGFLMCKKGEGEVDMERVERSFREFEERGVGTTYYHPRLQKSSFVLPLWAEKAIYGKIKE